MFMQNIIDVIILLFLLMGAVIGFKKGVIKSVVSFVGTILVLVLSFTLKNPLSVFLYTYLPFFNVGIAVVNILIYEGIAFLIVFALLSTVLRIVIKISGIIETLLKFTIILGIPSKILGAILGFFEMYMFIFAVLFALAQFNVHSSLITDSKMADFILSHTPFVSHVMEDTYNGVKEVVTLNKNYQNSQDKEKLNQDGLDVLLKYNVLSVENANKLLEKGKLKIKDADSIVKKYEKESKK